MVGTLERCPGIYCGRILYDNGSWSECGACPRSTRVNESFACATCTDELSTYSWLYLGFMAMLPLMLNWFFIDLDAKDRNCKYNRQYLINTVARIILVPSEKINLCKTFCRNISSLPLDLMPLSLRDINDRISNFTDIKRANILNTCAIVEAALSASLSILLMEPIWQFRLYACEVRKFTDWYTLFYNPAPNYDERLHCTQEAVYPLQTIVLVYYFLCLVTMFLVRPLVSAIFDIRCKAPIYSALYFLPLLTFIHSLACGLIYYSFPYLSVAISMITNAIHYSLKLDQSMKALIQSSVMETKNFVIISVHWILLAYGIISLGHHYALLICVPFPSIFYIITVRFTDPAEFRDREERPN